MSYSKNRRKILLAAASVPFAAVATASAGIAAAATAGGAARRTAAFTASAKAQLVKLEDSLQGRLGVFVHDTAGGARLAYRANERFPVCSTFKMLLASAILERSGKVAGLLQRRIRYARSDFVEYSPITEKHIADGMTVAELCAAAIQYSDNTAANLLMKILGGPAAVTAFARSIGDREFRLDRWETELNTATPGDARDTSTPAAMGRSLGRLALENALAPRQRSQLCDWLRGNTTGAARIRAAVPSDWQVGDKTGTGDYGTANDIAVLWPPRRAPMVVAIYTTQRDKAAQARNDVIAAAARIAVDWLG